MQSIVYKVLSSLLAILSYLPFELVAKTSLIVFSVLFITDPFPPASRVIAIIGVVVVGMLSKMEKRCREVNEQEASLASEIMEDINAVATNEDMKKQE